MIENISPISKEISKLKSDKGNILQVLKDGSEKDEAIASEKVLKIPVQNFFTQSGSWACKR